MKLDKVKYPISISEARKELWYQCQCRDSTYLSSWAVFYTLETLTQPPPWLVRGAVHLIVTAQYPVKNSLALTLTDWDDPMLPRYLLDTVVIINHNITIQPANPGQESKM